MPSFWPDIRLDVLYVAVVVAVLKSAYKGEKRPRRQWCSARSARPRLRLGLASLARTGAAAYGRGAGAGAARRALCVLS